MVREILLFLLSILFLTGCALSDEPEPEVTRMPALLPNEMPTPLFEGSCEEDLYGLEVWLGTSISEAEKLQSIIDQIVVVAEIDLEQQGVALTQIRYRIYTLPTPDCAIVAHELFLSLVNEAYRMFAQYSGGEIQNLQNALTNETFQALFNAVKAEQNMIIEEFMS